jgi:hypothetical protein
MATFARGVRREDRVLASRLIRAMRPGVALDVPQAELEFSSKLPGDNQALRGIPAIGRGVAGAIRGTSPDREVMLSDT